ncbi:hypothetical protein EV421DRAFT_1830167 [Armillaria borealis]|uniref:HNH nuclease domain-containing protein n=1 Tax=Armillaria borealis TaxID=47425 RepID=A0AA39MKE8_9AGAR|nr:hypothetical protein EV421DRAFT_1830167 [Armillaria borealis]
MESKTPTRTFIVRAQVDVSLLRNDPGCRLERPSTVDKDIHPEAVLEAMLGHATGAEEDDSKTPRRYVACAVTTAGQDYGIEQLIELANTWVRYLFWPFKANKSDIRGHHSASEIATPTLNETETFHFEGSRLHNRTFEDMVKERDGSRCIISKLIDWKSTTLDSTDLTADVEAAHIFKRAAAAGKRSKNSLAEYATWDILRHFIALSEEQVAELDDNIDYVYNGITLEHTLHSIFDQFGWSLRPDPDHHDRYHLEYFIRNAPGIMGIRNTASSFNSITLLPRFCVLVVQERSLNL